MLIPMIGWQTFEENMKHSVLLDTSFFVHLLDDRSSLHNNAIGYYKYYLEKEIALKISTITIAEYCVKGKIEELPLKNIQIIPFNLSQAKRTGEFAKIIFEEKKVSKEKLLPRAIIPNDSKLFAQADLDKSITHFVTSDSRSKSIYSTLKQKTTPKFEIIDINTPYNEKFSILF